MVRIARVIAALSFAAFLLFVLFSSVSGQPIVSGVVSHWSLEETSGVRYDDNSTNDLADYNSVNSSSGLIGSAASFEHDDHEYLYIASSAFDFGTSNFSLCSWTNHESFDGANQGVFVFGVLSGSSNYAYMINLTTSISNYRLLLVDSGSTARQYNFPTAISASEWHYICSSVDFSNDIIALYTDAISTTYAYTYDMKNVSGGDFALGKYPNATNRNMDGLIDQAVVFDYALSEEEVTWLYNNGDGRTYGDIIAASVLTPSVYSFNHPIYGNATLDMSATAGDLFVTASIFGLCVVVLLYVLYRILLSYRG